MKLVQRATTPVRLVQPSTTKIFDIMCVTLTWNKTQLFPTRRRPKLRKLDTNTALSTVTELFRQSKIKISANLTDTQRENVHRLFFTRRDVYETDLLHIRRTDLIEHAIVLTQDTQPYRAKNALYSQWEI